MKSILIRSGIFYSRILLGSLFFFASLGKVTDVKTFAVLVADYRLLPKFFHYPFAWVLGWTELVCGVWLLLGIRRRWAGALAAWLTALFLAVGAVSLARGLEIDCGCFDFPFLGPAKIGWQFLVRNSVLLAMALTIALPREEGENDA